MTASDALLELPFDQYQRYKVAADLAGLLGVAPGSRVLDVGGAPGRVEDFLPDRDTVVVDVNGLHPGRFVIGSGAALPFPSASFRAVLALDTLEHVPAELRAEFLAELRRVADIVILSAPFADHRVELAEKALAEFVVNRIGEFPTLDEHAENGLPYLEAMCQEFEKDNWHTATLPSGYLPRWLAGMLLHHELLATGLPELSRLHAYYNATVSPLDCREPSYRHVIVAGRHTPQNVLNATVASLRTDGDTVEAETALRSIASAVFAQRLGGVLRSREVSELEAELGNVQSRASALERAVADRDAHLLELRAENERLRSTLGPFKGSVSRIRQKLHSVLDRRNR